MQSHSTLLTPSVMSSPSLRRSECLCVCVFLHLSMCVCVCVVFKQVACRTKFKPYPWRWDLEVWSSRLQPIPLCRPRRSCHIHTKLETSVQNCHRSYPHLTFPQQQPVSMSRLPLQTLAATHSYNMPRGTEVGDRHVSAAESKQRGMMDTFGEVESKVHKH